MPKPLKDFEFNPAVAQLYRRKDDVEAIGPLPEDRGGGFIVREANGKLFQYAEDEFNAEFYPVSEVKRLK